MGESHACVEGHIKIACTPLGLALSSVQFHRRAAVVCLQMTGGGRHVVLGPCHADSMHPDLDWLEAELAGPQPPKLVVLVNPCNPTGSCVQQACLAMRIHQSCLAMRIHQACLAMRIPAGHAALQRHQLVCANQLRQSWMPPHLPI